MKYKTQQKCFENQIWKQIENYENYEVSNLGRVRRYSSYYNKYFYLGCGDDGDGHKRLVISINGKVIARKPLHVLVFETFFRKLQSNEVVHHLNFQKECNQCSNLVAWDKSRHTSFHNSINPRTKDTVSGKFLKKSPQ